MVSPEKTKPIYPIWLTPGSSLLILRQAQASVAFRTYDSENGLTGAANADGVVPRFCRNGGGPLKPGSLKRVGEFDDQGGSAPHAHLAANAAEMDADRVIGDV